MCIREKEFGIQQQQNSDDFEKNNRVHPESHFFRLLENDKNVVGTHASVHEFLLIGSFFQTHNPATYYAIKNILYFSGSALYI